MKKVIVWFQRDFRLSDNPALAAAAKNGVVYPIYIVDGVIDTNMASWWWLLKSVSALKAALNNNLSIFKGNPEVVLPKLVAKLGIDAVYWNEIYEPKIYKRNDRIRSLLEKEGVFVETFQGSLLWAPWETAKADDTPYKVFTPFMKHAMQNVLVPRKPIGKPRRFTYKKLHSKDFKEWVLPKLPVWSKKFEQHWEPSEEGAKNRLKNFLQDEITSYAVHRDYPDFCATSRLSPYLHFGELSPNQIWYAVKNTSDSKSATAYLRQLIWREFSYHMLYYYPKMPTKNWKDKFDQFPWRKNKKLFEAWKKGLTGYPIVDAGMRELWQTGYMHNRVRMIVASFLVKNCLIDWREGASYFLDTLLDADLANNSMGWQWVAGSGADASPFFRIFNPILQAKKFDPMGSYVCQYVPELSKLPNKYIYAPWEAGDLQLSKAGIKLGFSYPKPIVNLMISRQRALSYYKKLK